MSIIGIDIPSPRSDMATRISSSSKVFPAPSIADSKVDSVNLAGGCVSFFSNSVSSTLADSFS
mgnify:CR=1 FL=1